MDLLKKVETLINAKARAALPRRERRTILDDEEEKLLAEIRATLQDVAAQERQLAQRVKAERAEAKDAAQRGDRAEQHAHERRAIELERRWEEEATLSINLEEKLAALEQKLNLAKEAVDKEAKKAATIDAAAEEVLAGHSVSAGGNIEPEGIPPEVDIIPDDFSDDDPNTAARKSRLSA